jgi:hypothetical protein
VPTRTSLCRSSRRYAFKSGDEPLERVGLTDFRSRSMKGCMYATVILDSYEASEPPVIASALDELCGPSDNYGWAFEGIYCFFDPVGSSALYIGLAEDLAMRFRQHNRLLPCPERSCKAERIAGHFASNQRLGFGVFVQSTLDQGTVHRNRQGRLSSADGAGRRNAVYTEGRLIEAYRQAAGVRPPWNEMGGAVVGGADARPEDMVMVKAKALSGETDNYLVARATLRELAGDAHAANCESNLHGAGLFALWMGGRTLEEGLDFLKQRDPHLEVPAEYLARRVRI